MTNDLETRLQTLVDQSPTGAPADLDHVLARGRTIRRRRHAAMAFAGAACVAGVATLAVAFASPAPRPPVVTEPPSSSEGPSSPPTPTPDTITLSDVRLPLGLIDDQGLHPNELADVPAIDGPVDRAYSDGDGGLVYQRADQPQRIYWLRGGETLEYDVWPGPTTLLGVVGWEGVRHIVFGAAIPGAEVPSQAIQFYRVATDNDEPLTAGTTFQTISTDLEVEIADGIAVTDDGRLVVSSCHLLCSTHTVPLDHPVIATGDVSADGPLGDPRPTWGLDGTTDGRMFSLAAVTSGQDLEQLTLEQVTAEGHTLDSIEIPMVDAIDGAGLQVTGDGSAAIIELRDGGETTRWLLVQDLDQPAPRIREITDVAGLLVVLGP